MLFKGLLDNLEFSEIIAILSIFINEKDQGGDEKYISSLKVPKNVSNIIKSISIIAEYYINLEDKHNLIHSKQ